MRKTLIFGIFFCYSSFVYSQENAKDTSVYQLPEISVKAKTIYLKRFEANTTFGITEIQNKPDQTITDVIKSSAGLYIKDYGGAGGIKTVLIRGGSSAQNTVLLNGIALNSSAVGGFDFSSIPALFFNSINIIRGGNSAQYGNNALSGVVQLSSNPSDSNSVFLSLGLKSYASYNSQIYANKVVKSSVFSIAGAYENSKGDFPFQTNQFGNNLEYRRQNGNFENLSFLISNKISLNKNSDLLNLVVFNKSERGVPGAVLQGKPENKSAQMDDMKLLFSTKYAYNREYGAFNTAFLYAYGKLNYHDKDNAKYGLNSNALFNENTISALVDFKSGLLIYKTFLNYKISADTKYEVLDGNMLQPETSGTVERQSFSISGDIEGKHPLNKIQLSELLSYRFSQIDDFNFNSIFFGYNIDLLPINTTFTLSISKNFRLPSFNELYYLNYGNTNLIPENSLSKNMKITWYYEYPQIFNIVFNTNIFILTTNDKIVSLPRSPVSWSSMNIGKTEAKGIEFDAEIEMWKKMWKINLSYSRQDVIDKTNDSKFYGKLLPYIPQEILSLILNNHNRFLDISMDLSYSSFRYTTADNSIYYVQKNYFTIDLMLCKTFILNKTKFGAKFGIRNLLDTKYEIISNYPMPGNIFTINLFISK